MASVIDLLGYPVMIRPSNVLGGRAMAILRNTQCLKKYLTKNQNIILDGPILIDRFLEHAIEIDVDAISDGQDVYIAGMMQHIEHAGIHSGDSACVLPPYSLSTKMQNEITQSTVKLAKALRIKGFINVQYAVYREKLYVIEVNPRVSRTVPFVAKATRLPIAAIASQIIAEDKKLSDFKLPSCLPQYFSVKEVVLPFARFSGVDFLLGPEMKSTGEVMGWDKNLSIAFAKAQMSAFNKIPIQGTALVVYPKERKKQAFFMIQSLIDLGFKVGVVKELVDDHLPANVFCLEHALLAKKQDVKKIKEGQEGMMIKKEDTNFAFLSLVDFLDFMQSERVKLVISIENSESLKVFRQAILLSRVSYFSTHESALLALDFIKYSQKKKPFDSDKDWRVAPIQIYFPQN